MTREGRTQWAGALRLRHKHLTAGSMFAARQVPLRLAGWGVLPITSSAVRSRFRVTLVFHSGPFEPFPLLNDAARMFLSKLRGRGCSTGVPRLKRVWDVSFLIRRLSAQARSPSEVSRMNPLLWIFGLVFRCRHSQMSRVFTIKGRTYQVCFKCGKEFDLAEP